MVSGCLANVNEKQQENSLTGALKMYSTGAKYSHYHFICIETRSKQCTEAFDD